MIQFALTSLEQLIDPELQQKYGVVKRLIVGAFLLARAEAVVDRHFVILSPFVCYLINI